MKHGWTSRGFKRFLISLQISNNFTVNSVQITLGLVAFHVATIVYPDEEIFFGNLLHIFIAAVCRKIIICKQ